MLVIICLALVSLVIYGGWRIISVDTQDYSYLSVIGGYGLVKEVRSDSIVLTSQIDEDKIFEAEITENTCFFQSDEMIETFIKEEEFHPEKITLEDIMINKKIYFYIQPNVDGSLTLLWLNMIKY